VVKTDGAAHKAREGGVVLGITTPDAAADAARRLGGGPVLVARQVGPGLEVLCGMTRDPDFGPILAVGRGGVEVEELDSVRVSSAPLDIASAAALVADAGVDDPHGVLAETLVALGDLALANPRIASVEVNPLIVTVSATTAVDALVILAD
jgi:succinyl-CoA synthetase beta subunit